MPAMLRLKCRPHQQAITSHPFPPSPSCPHLNQRVVAGDGKHLWCQRLDDVGARVKVAVHSVAKAKQLLLLSLDAGNERRDVLHLRAALGRGWQQQTRAVRHNPTLYPHHSLLHIDTCNPPTPTTSTPHTVVHTLPMRASMRSTASLAPPCSGPYSAPTAPAMAVYTSTPLDDRWRTAAVEQFISCSACRMNRMSCERGQRRWHRSVVVSTTVYRQG